MTNKKGFTLVEVVVSFIIIAIVIINIAAFFLFAWNLKVRFEEDRAVLGILTSFIEAKKAQVIGTTLNRNAISYFGIKGEFGSWKTYCINMWNYKDADRKKNNIYPPLDYPLPYTKYSDGKIVESDDNKYVNINYQWCRIEIKRAESIGENEPKPQYFLMPSVYVWCETPSGSTIGMQVTNAFPWRNYNNGHNDNL